MSAKIPTITLLGTRAVEEKEAAFLEYFFGRFKGGDSLGSLPN